MLRKGCQTIYINPSIVTKLLVDTAAASGVKCKNPIVITHQRRQLATSSVNTNTNNNNSNDDSVRNKNTITLPEPTWSISSLELNKNHQPISVEELQVLAKRAIIDLNTIDLPTDQLRQDIGNMMNMINQVVTNTSTANNTEQQFTVEELYDKPRGVISAPFFSNDKITSEQQQLTIQKESESIWKNYLQTKLKRKGSHNYFVIATSIASNDDEQKTIKSKIKKKPSPFDDEEL
jgi:hypothetical protein